MRPAPKTNRQLTIEVNRLRKRLAYLESYMIQLSRFVLVDMEVAPGGAPIVPAVQERAVWGPPLAAPALEEDEQDWSEAWARGAEEQEEGETDGP